MYNKFFVTVQQNERVFSIYAPFFAEKSLAFHWWLSLRVMNRRRGALGLGLAIGFALGAAMHSIGLGIAFGVAVGVALDGLYTRNYKRKH